MPLYLPDWSEMVRGVTNSLLRSALFGNVDNGVWSAGVDIAELPLGEDPLLNSDPLEQLLRAIRHFPAPVIAKEMIFTARLIKAEEAEGDHLILSAVKPRKHRCHAQIKKDYIKIKKGLALFLKNPQTVAGYGFAGMRAF